MKINLFRRVGRALKRLPHSPPPIGPIRVVLWGKADCGLCERAEAILNRLGTEYPLQIDHRDILADPTAFARFRYRIPVIEIEDGPSFEGKITELWLRRAFGEIRRRRSSG